MIITTTQKTEIALLDSGATENFIDPRTIEQLRLPIRKLRETRVIYNIDGTPNKAGSISHRCQLQLSFGEGTREMDFFVTDLGQDRIVLGFPFLQQFNPNINWENKTISPTGNIRVLPKPLWEHRWKVWKQDRRLLPKCKILRKVSFAQQWSAIADKSKTKLEEEGVPHQYRNHREVFSEKGAERLPPLREENMAITFKEGAPEQLDCHVYPLSKKELEVLRKSLDEDLKKGYIKHGTSSYVSPIFFIPKKDGDELRMVIDYRQLNDITKKDFYPLPNLRTELKKLSQHKLFSKFDVRAGYNNIRINEEDQHKAAFKTPLGTFIPAVMTFGFCNAPSIFQRAMNRDLEPLKQEYPNNFANYMDDVAIGTDSSPEGQKLHEEIIHKFLDILGKHSYYLKVSKCEFCKPQMEFLGFLVGNGTVKIDPSKIGGITDWPRELHSIKELRQILGVLGYQRAFIQDYARLAKPLNDLLKKGVQFKWTTECRNALDELIKQVTQDPILVAPNEEQPFELETDASAYAVGAALFQKDERGKRRAIGYASKTLIAAERNYDIWDREFLGLIFGLTYWRHLLSGTKHPVKVYVDHANLLHYRHPQKVNRRVARYILTLADYNIQIQYRPGPQNRADALSRRPDYDQGEEDNTDITPLPSHLFEERIRSSTLDTLIETSQMEDESEFKRLERTHGWEKRQGLWKKEGKTAILSEQVKSKILQEHHDHPTAGHPGTATTYFSVRTKHWWPQMKEWIQRYVKGCGVCQQNKTNTRPQKPPLYPITPKEGAAPFETIAMDWITKLPPSMGYDAILTITDHDCSKAALFFPCKETMTTEELARLYFARVFPHYGIPNKIISDRDTRLTSTLAKEICKEAGINQNISTAYHPQTDGQSERTNQTLETFLRIFCNEQQNDWAKWIPLAQYAINTRPSHTTKIPPYELLIGIIPKAQITPIRIESPIWARKEQLTKLRQKAHDAILHSQMMMIKDSSFRAYQIGEKVWLDAKNLKTTHPTHKLRAKRYGPFPVTNVLSHVAYQLQLPNSWKIHNVFHASYLSPYKETIEHGPNFLEPLPEIIEGHPEWEVEAIVGTRLFGRKKQRQYRVHWKDFSNAEDTWEPEDNIHAPDLIQKYWQSQPLTIRRARVGIKLDMLPPSQFTAPDQPSIAPPSRAVSYSTPPSEAERISTVLTKYRIPRAVTRLERFAQHVQERQEEQPEEDTGTHSPMVGTQNPDYQTDYHSGSRRESGPPFPESIPHDYPDNTREAARSTELLGDPVVKYVEDLGHPSLTMGGDSDSAPAPPWFTKPSAPTLPQVTATTDSGHTIPLPYLRYALVDNEPMLLGTTGRDKEVYGEYLRALPAPTLPFQSTLDDGALEELYTDHPFNWTMNLALFHLGDAGILADVHRYRSAYTKLHFMKRENSRLANLVEHLQKEQEKHNDDIRTFIQDVQIIRQRLTAARVITRLSPIYKRMAVEGLIMNSYYPQTYKETSSSTQPFHQQSPTPGPSLQATNPDPVSPVSAKYSPESPTSQYRSMDPVVIPPRIDYAAGNPTGPHHQPTMFDTEDNNGWPPLPSRQITIDNTEVKKQAGQHRCFYCLMKGHWNSQCPTPHFSCTEAERCIVPLNHPLFVQACEMGQRTRGNHPTGPFRKRKRHCEASDFEGRDTPGPAGPSDSFRPNTPTGLPPADSLLFSPHPSPSEFATSPYQASLAPGEWGKEGWDAPWADYPRAPKSPCIFDFGRGSSEEQVPLLPNLDLDCEEESLCAADREFLELTEDQLPGAIYHYDTDPLAPTSALVNSSLSRRVRDMGLSG